jgi:hypothetical protein
MTHHQDTAADLVLFNGRVTTLSAPHPEVSAVAVREGKFLVAGSDGDVLALRRPATRVIDLGGRRVIPGLNDTHLRKGWVVMFSHGWPLNSDTGVGSSTPLATSFLIRTVMAQADFGPSFSMRSCEPIQSSASGKEVAWPKTDRSW